MNCTKFTPPLQIFVDFFYYYSTFTLFLSLFITPAQFYIILTKSKTLHNFKWLILNNSFWCIIIEIFVSVFKPFSLLPAIGGFSIGFFPFKNRIISLVGFVAFAVLLCIQCASVFLLIVNRYLFVFPSKIIAFVNKKLFIFCGTLYVSITILIFSYSFYPYLFIEAFEDQKAAIKFDPCLKMYFHEPGFFFLPSTESSFFFFLSAFAFCCFCYFVIASFFCFFIYRVYFHETASIVKLQKSLITSVIVQVGITLIFVCTPICGAVSVMTFQSSNAFSSNLCQIGYCAVSTHSLLESFATLYFVTPYRKAIKGDLEYYIPYFKKRVVPVKIIKISQRNTQTQTIILKEIHV